MTQTERQKTYTNAYIRYGRDHQAAVAIEELSECQKEICKFLRGYGNKEHLAEEVADAIIVLEQVTQFYGLQELISMYMDVKIKRLDETLRKESLQDG